MQIAQHQPIATEYWSLDELHMYTPFVTNYYQQDIGSKFQQFIIREFLAKLPRKSMFLVIN